MDNCAKCGKKLGLFSEKYDSETDYIMFGLSLDYRYPDNPYKGMNLCEKCYREVYKNAPALPDEKSQKTEGNLDTHSGMILASQILSDPILLNKLTDKYVIVYDMAVANTIFNTLNVAINIMAEQGWSCKCITTFSNIGRSILASSYMYALMEKLG
jgi:hypothetical protein